jgi:hypothetical protein
MPVDVTDLFESVSAPPMYVDADVVLARGRRRRLRRRVYGAAVVLAAAVLVMPVADVLRVDAASPQIPAGAPSSSRAGVPTGSATLTPAAPKCQVPTPGALAAVNATITADAKGNSLPRAVVMADPASGMWFVAGAFAGPAAKGEGALGIWATTTDPTKEPFTGKVFAVDGGAIELSTAPVTEATSYDPERAEVLGCWPPQ